MPRIRPRPWVRCLNSAPLGAERLICFPHSGGSAQFYAPWAASLGSGVQLMAVQYPGRGDRFGETFAESIQRISSFTAAELSEFTPAPFALFGHSFGAIVAYETAIKLRDAGTPPLCLLVSGSAPPQHTSGGRTHLASDDELWSSVRQLGGIEPEIADNDELVEMLLPALRADISAHESYLMRPDTIPLSCPVRCYYGIGDHLVDEAQLSGWAEISTGPFTLCSRKGAHFHLTVDIHDLVNDILTVMEEELTKGKGQASSAL
jgi:surfactin synthase thioesterase subunit